MEGELDNGWEVGCFVDSDPMIGRDREETLCLVVGERLFLSGQDRDRDERAVVERAKEEVTRPADVTECYGGRSYGVQSG